MLIRSAGQHEGIKKLLLVFSVLAQMLRVPLDAETEGMTGPFQGFDDAVGTDSRDGQILSQTLYGLMMKTVDPDLGSAKDSVKLRAGRDVDAVGAFCPVFEIRMPGDILMQCAAAEDV